MIGVIQNEAIADNLQHRFVVNQLVAQIETANACIQELQNRLQASEEAVRFFDQANAELCAQLLDVAAKLQTYEQDSEQSKGIIAQQKAEIARLTAALKKAKFNIKELMIDEPF